MNEEHMRSLSIDSLAMTEPTLSMAPRMQLREDSVTLEDIPRAVVCDITSHSASPPRNKASNAYEAHILPSLRQQNVPDALLRNQLFSAAVKDLVEGKAIISDSTLCAAHILSVKKIGTSFEGWLESSVANQVWRYSHLTKLQVNLVDYESKRLLIAWLHKLSLIDKDLQDAVWAVYKLALGKHELRRESLYIVLACVIFACAKLFDVDCTFAQIIKASKRDEKIFLNVRLESGQTGNVLQWYNDCFLPSMKKVIIECKECSIPFPSSSPDYTIFLSPFVTVSVSPFRNRLSIPPAKASYHEYVFNQWYQI